MSATSCSPSIGSGKRPISTRRVQYSSIISFITTLTFLRLSAQFGAQLFRQRFLRDVSQLGRINLDHISSDPEGATEAIATADLIHQARMNVLAGSWQGSRVVYL